MPSRSTCSLPRDAVKVRPHRSAPHILASRQIANRPERMRLGSKTPAFQIELDRRPALPVALRLCEIQAFSNRDPPKAPVLLAQAEKVVMNTPEGRKRLERLEKRLARRRQKLAERSA